MNKDDTIMRNNMRALALPFSLLLLLSLSLGLAACGAGATSDVPSNEVDMGFSTFVQPSRTIKVGESIHFVNEQSGVTHVICLGREGNCDTSAMGPQELSGQGLTIQPGQTQDVRFDAAGAYAITCPIHPKMNLSITVQ
jgi:plastocyanin